jgi:hypothetical protein
MKIYDKAAWQIDNRMNEKTVIKHFSFIFSWLKEHNMLNKDGLDVLDIVIDQDLSLNESLVTAVGVKFLDMYYDEIITQSEYDIELEETLLSSLYENFKQS